MTTQKKHKKSEDVVTIQVNMPIAYADAVSWETQCFFKCVFHVLTGGSLELCVCVEGFFIGFKCIKLFES